MLAFRDLGFAMKRRQFVKMASACTASLTLPAFALDNTAKSGWQQVNALPYAMQEIYPVIHQNQLVVAGGLEINPTIKATLGPLSISHSVYVYDFVQQQWQLGPNLPVARHHLGLVSHQGRLLAIGGFYADQSDAWQCQAGCYQLVDKQWQAMMSLPQPQAEAVYLSSSSGAHVVSGRTLTEGKLVDTNQHWLLQDGRWRSAAPLPVAVNSAAGAVYKDDIYLVGGRTQIGKQLTNQNQFHRYDASKDRWHALPPIPQATAGIAAVVWQDELYVFGGEHYQLKDQRYITKTYADVWRYNFAKQTWLPGLDLPNGLHGMGAVTTPQGILVIGGANKAGGEQTSAEIYQL